jgi:hypothetical protein
MLGEKLAVKGQKMYVEIGVGGGGNLKKKKRRRKRWRNEG